MVKKVESQYLPGMSFDLEKFQGFMRKKEGSGSVGMDSTRNIDQNTELTFGLFFKQDIPTRRQYKITAVVEVISGIYALRSDSKDMSEVLQCLKRGNDVGACNSLHKVFGEVKRSSVMRICNDIEKLPKKKYRGKLEKLFKALEYSRIK